MKNKSQWIFLITVFMIGLAMAGIVKASLPTIAMDPPEVKDLEPGESFTVNITVTNMVIGYIEEINQKFNGLYGWSINLTFDPDILTVTNVTEGPFLQQAGNTVPLPVERDNTVGYVFAGAMFMPPLPPEGATGSGVLATVIFTVKGKGVTDIELGSVKLRTVIAGNNVEIGNVNVGITNGKFVNAAPTILSVEFIFAIVAVVAIGGSIVVVLYRRRTSKT